MTAITALKSAPNVVDPNEVLPVVHPSEGGCQTTVDRLVKYVAGNVVSDLQSVMPLWTATTTEPILADGKLQAHVSTVGKTRTAMIYLRLGASTVKGEGAWIFRLPEGLDDKAAVDAIGIARALHGTTMTIGVAEIVADSCELKVASSMGHWGPALPTQWGEGDTLSLSITYRIV